MRCSDSARLESGNLPMSSAEIASTTPVASRLISMEAFKLPRKPVTTTSSSSSRRLFLGEYRVDEHCTTNDGEQCLRGYRQCLSD